MRDKLCVSERRARMLDFLVKRKESTRFELASEFGVSISTIHRDIFISAALHLFTLNKVIKVGFTYCQNSGAIKIISQKQRKTVFML